MYFLYKVLLFVSLGMGSQSCRLIIFDLDQKNVSIDELTNLFTIQIWCEDGSMGFFISQ